MARTFAVGLVVGAPAVAAPAAARAQSAADLAAWNGLMLTPVGALPAPPFGHGDAGPRTSLTLGYGHWQYDADDVPHDNIGLTLARRFGFAHSTVALTGVYLRSGCTTCAAWQSTGLDVGSTFWTSGTPPTSDGLATNASATNASASSTSTTNASAAGASGSRLGATLGARLSGGAARYLGRRAASARSAALRAALGGDLRLSRHVHLDATVLPGLGVGHLTSADETGGGTRVLLGGTLGASIGRAFRTDVSVQRVVLTGAPDVYGIGVSWRFW